MRKNLDVCYYRNGNLIPEVQDPALDDDFYIHIYDMPQEEYDTYSFASDPHPCYDFSASIRLPDGNNFYATGGYLIKTGYKSFEFGFQYQSGGSTYTVEGKGDYIHYNY